MVPTLRWRGPGRQGQQRGFSLAELLAVIGVMAVLFAIAVPRYNAWRAANALQTASETLMAHVQQARVMAVTGNRDVSIDFTPTGYTVDTTGAQPQSYALSDYGGGLSLSANVTSLNFNSNGTSNAGTVTLSDPDGGTRAITVNVVGRAYCQ